MKNTYKELAVWQGSKKLVTVIYKLTSSFPSEEKFGIISQIRRAVISIPVNIAEGHGRNNRKEFIQFLGIAKGSISEVETLLEISIDLGFLDKEIFEDLDKEISMIHKMLIGLIRSLRSMERVR